jgi:hypothetical protein
MHENYLKKEYFVQLTPRRQRTKNGGYVPTLDRERHSLQKEGS